MAKGFLQKNLGPRSVSPFETSGSVLAPATPSASAPSQNPFVSITIPSAEDFEPFLYKEEACNPPSNEVYNASPHCCMARTASVECDRLYKVFKEYRDCKSAVRMSLRRLLQM